MPASVLVAKSLSRSRFALLRRFGLAIVALFACFALSACTGGNSGTTPPPPPPPDTTPPTAPANLTAMAASSTQINLAWTASTDNVGVTGYQIQRCQGAACVNFANLGAPVATTTFNDTGLTASTSYSYRVSAKDAANNVSAFSNTATATTNGSGSAISVSITPRRGGITTSQALSFTATVNNDVGSVGVTWTKTGGAFSTQTTSAATFSSTMPGSFTITATSKADTSKAVSVTIGVTDLSAVATYHNDLSRDGANQQEYALTPASVTSSTFGKLFSCQVDGAVYAQPLWVSNVAIGGGTHNVVFIATQHDSVYAFDADGTACTQFWKASLLDSAHGAGPGAGPVNPSDTGETGDISSEIGITGTPVIDPAAKTLFVVSKSGETSGFHQRLHALNLADGTERVNPPKDITSAITVTGSADTGDSTVGCTAPTNNVPFCPLRENQRPGLVLANGLIYVTWASHGDISPYHGWVMSFNATTLALVDKFNSSPNGRQSGIWMAGAAPAVDNSGNLYVITGNGDLNVAIGSYGDSFVKLASNLTVSDWFSPFDQANLDGMDLDLGSGGAAILVDLPLGSPVQHLIVGGGKGTGFDGELYVLDRDNLHHNNNPDIVVQEFPLGSGIFATAAFWQNTLYIAAVSKPLAAFTLDPTSSMFNTTPAAGQQSSTSFGFPGATPSVSSSATTNGIVWAIDSSANGKSDTNTTRTAGPAVLHAYNATHIATELWNSTQGTGNTAGNAVKFTVPTIANGKVYIGTRGNDSTQGSGTVFGELDVYGLIP